MSATELEQLVRECTQCDKCPLRIHRSNIVFGTGTLGGIMLIGEAPGEQEDRTGYPFIGSSGKCLTQMLLEAGIEPLYTPDHQDLNDQSDVYITNTVLCRPVLVDGMRKKNRAPSKTEVKACSERLFKEVLIVDPTVIVIMGEVAREALVPRKLSVGDFTFARIKSGDSVIYYPAYYVHHPAFIVRKGCSSDHAAYRNVVDTFKKVKLYDSVVYKLKKGEDPFIIPA